MWNSSICKFPVLYMHFLFSSRSCFHSLVHSFFLSVSFVHPHPFALLAFSRKKIKKKKKRNGNDKEMSLSFNGWTRGNVIIVLSSFFIIMLCFSCTHTHTHSLSLYLSIYLSIFFLLFYYRSPYRVTRDVFDRWTRLQDVFSRSQNTNIGVAHSTTNFNQRQK